MGPIVNTAIAYLFQQDINNRWMLMLELTIGFLFVIELVVLVMGLKH